MNELESAQNILRKILDKLGFEADIECEQTNEVTNFNIITDESSCLIGKHGDRLDDLQYLVNRILSKNYPNANRIKIDCDHYRANQEKAMIETAISLARQVLEDGKTRSLKPLNAYYRRLVHNALVELDGIQTSSPQESSRYKRIEISKISTK